MNLKFIPLGQGIGVGGTSTAGIFRDDSGIVWLICCVLIFAIFLSHLSLWPALGQDEAQTVDLGRVFLDPDADWSTGWLVDQGRPLVTPAYLGTVFQELAYRVFEPGYLGPRLSALIGAILAASMVLGWLRCRGTSKWYALTLALVFLLDPILNGSYRQGRADSWAIAACVATCWLLNSARLRAANWQRYGAKLVWAGMLAGASPFVWPSSLALFPLMAVEFSYLLRGLWESGIQDRPMRIGQAFLWAVVGGLLAISLLFVPILLQWDSQLISLGPSAHIQRVASAIQISIVDLYGVHDPMIIPALAAALLIRREPLLILALAATLLMIYQTMIYGMRVIYLLPYLVAILAGASATLTRQPNARWRGAIFHTVFALLVSWNVAVSLVVRPSIAFSQREARSPNQIEVALEEIIGRGPHRVLSTEWDTYYAGRALGWKTYMPFGRIEKASNEYQDFLRSMEFAIVRDKFSFMKATSTEELVEAGFERVTTISFTQPESGRIAIGPFKINAQEVIFEDLQVFRNPSIQR